MANRYDSFSELAEGERRGQDFRVRLRKRAGGTAIIAPHGGGIEPGTSEIADAIAADDLSFYAFEGIKSHGNGNLHITSTRFDEPRCAALVEASTAAISVHGEDSQRVVVFLGGRDGQTLNGLRASLAQNGFCVESHPSPRLQGLDQANTCNRTRSGVGVQLELSKGMRRSFFQSLSKNGRRSQTQRFRDFVAAVTKVIP